MVVVGNQLKLMWKLFKKVRVKITAMDEDIDLSKSNMQTFKNQTQNKIQELEARIEALENP